MLSVLLAGAVSCAVGGEDDPGAIETGEGEEVAGAVAQPLCSALSLGSNDADFDAIPGAQVTFTGTSTCTGTAQYRFYTSSPGGGAWTLARDWAASNSFVWNTTGLAYGQWRVQVQVRDTTSGSQQRYVTKAFTLASSPPCSALTVTSAPKELTAGTNVNVTSVAAGCTNPEYQLWHRPPGGSYTSLGAFAPGNANYVWNSTGAVTGVHVLQVRVRRQGSTRTYEKYTNVTANVLVANKCTSVALGLNPATTGPAGTPVTLTAAAAGCSTAEYRFFVRPPGGAYTEIQAYSSSNAAVWNTTLLPAGTYNLQVWTRVPGSTASNMAYATKNYALTAATSASALSISGGWAHNCSLLNTGRIGCWGYSAHGEVGNGSTANKVTSPVAVTGITTAVGLASGYAFNCAVLTDGTGRCWGQNLHGQLGDGTTNTATTPVVVSGLTNAIGIGAGNSHACAVLSGGGVRCWGYNSQRQIGDNSTTDRTTPVTVPGLSNVAKISAGYYHTCAVSRTGAVSCWGRGAEGQLGNGGTAASATPVAVTGLTNVVSLSTFSSSNCAVKSDGTVWCWGTNGTYGKLGDGTTTQRNAPVQVVGVTGAKAVSIGANHACAALQSGGVTCWGGGEFGQLGNGADLDSLTAVPVSNLANAVSVAASMYTTCATRADNTSACWGYGALGSLGNGGAQDSNVPVAVLAVP